MGFEIRGRPKRLVVMHGAELVPGRISDIGKIEFAITRIAPARGVFNACTAVCDGIIVKSVGLLSGPALKTESTAISDRCGVTVQRLGDD